ncbi:cyclase family protein [Mucilaginibacter sp. KACC 22773]|uniref:cyclase family protein n=1 Tax=Mucilaginibacter sp. KACC 22773 TaxID=3025671 RepID=UPI0023657104|nr:cyclase family protein [Mucilaginibacter sp. KACC 22773]WDF79160.1 cyclase family protein [Mucilaginibacter sp. KACC 22773]
MIIRLSHIISQNTPSYGNKDRVFIRDNSSILKGETANTTCWVFSNNHIGTHIDSSFHFCQDGKKTFEIPLEEYFYKKVATVDIPCSEAKLIDVGDFDKLSSIDDNVELLLIRTGFENYRNDDKYWNNNPGLAPELADYFRTEYPRLRCVGFDFISLTSWKFRPQGRESHRQFLCPGGDKKSILVIEDMALNEAYHEFEWVVVAPLFVEDGNGGAVTVLAKKREL